MSETGGTPSLTSSETPPAATTPAPIPNGEAAPLIGAETAPMVTMENLKFPEGTEIDQEMANSLLGVLNDQNLPPEGRAQALVDLHLKSVESASEKASQFYRELQDEWVGQAIQEFGGEDKLRPMLADISVLIDEYGGTPDQRTELRDLFSLTGAGNSPRMVGLLHNLAKALTVEGKPMTGGQPATAGRTAAEILYPNMNRG
jgi:hypothetical protein